MIIEENIENIDELDELDEEGSPSMYEHYSFKAGKGQEPLRVDKFLMNFVETLLAIRCNRRLNRGIYS